MKAGPTFGAGFFMLGRHAVHVHGGRMKHLGTLVVTLGLAGPALGGPCNLVNAIDAHLEDGAKPAGAQECSTYRAVDGALGTSCHWAFPFRSEAAITFTQDAWESVKACRPGAPKGPDQQVNHPDSFDLLEWVSDGVTYRVSVKDKGALAQTLVFVGLVGSS